MDFPHLEKAPIPLAHEHPVEPPHGPARSPLRILALAAGFLLAFLALLWAIEVFRDDPAERPGPAIAVSVEGVTCPTGTPARSPCYLGVVTNRTDEQRTPRCSWSSADEPFRSRGGGFPVQPLALDDEMRSDVLVVRGGDATPSISCVS